MPNSYCIVTLIPSRVESFVTNFLLHHVRLLSFKSVLVVLVGDHISETFTRISSYPNVVVLTSPSTLSASFARNLGITKLLSLELDHLNSFVWLADDDCWYPSQYMPQVISRYSLKRVLLFSLCDPISGVSFSSAKKYSNSLSPWSLFSFPGPSFVIRLDSVLFYSVDYGPGTSLFAAEDTELLLRLWMLYESSSFSILQHSLFHPVSPQDPAKIVRYAFGQGSLFSDLLSRKFPLIRKFSILVSFVSYVFMRPMLGLLASILVLDFRKASFYRTRIVFLFRGVFGFQF